MKNTFTLLLFLMASQIILAQSTPEVDDRGMDKKPYTSLKLLNSIDDFRFAIISDRTGGHRKGVFEKGIAKINLLQPEFIMSVGDLIEGYTHDKNILNKEWEEIKGFVSKAEMPFFYVAGNHDYSNPTMEQIWTDNFGADYYHFKYKNVLFLCLNTEENFDNHKEGYISKKQFEYFKQCLNENKNVRWVFVFMHQPLWKYNDTKYWKPLDNILKKFKRTVFAGHIHHYTYNNINDVNYITLGTTGGISYKRGKAFGEVDHFTMVNFVNDNAVISNVLLSGIERHDFVNDESEKVFGAFYKNPPLYFMPQYNVANYRLDKINLVINNSSKYELEVDVKPLSNSMVHIATTNIARKVAANSKELIEIPVSIVNAEYYNELLPIIFHAHCKYNGMGNVVSNWEQNITFVPRTQYNIQKAATDISVDGNVSEWKNLPYTITDNTKRSPTTAKFGIVEKGDFIYFGADVIDPVIDFSGSKTPYGAESIILSIDLSDKTKSAFNNGSNNKENTVKIPFIISGKTGYNSNKAFLPTTVEGQYRLTAKGYQVECRFPKNKIAEIQGNPNWENIRINVKIVDRSGGHYVAFGWQADWQNTKYGTGIFVRSK